MYCEHCGVVAVSDNDKYCDGCIEIICNYLAEQNGEMPQEQPLADIELKAEDFMYRCIYDLWR